VSADARVRSLAPVIAVSTSWNAARHAGWAPAAAELLALGHRTVALDGAALHADARAVHKTVRAAKGEVVALFAPELARDEAGRPRGAGLVSPRDEVRAPAVAAARAAGAAALDAGTRRVVLRAGELPDVDPAREARWIDRLVREGRTDALAAEVRASVDAARRDRDRFAEALCRALFALTRALPDVEWALETPSRAGGLPRPEEAEAVFAELPGRRVGYWHDAAHAARLDALGAVPAGEWLARLGPRAAGVTISDWTPSAAGLPPGAGTVAWTALRAQLGSSMTRVLRLDASFPAALLDDALREARSLLP
jgi:sugar phosphate isomerase/epimerase